MGSLNSHIFYTRTHKGAKHTSCKISTKLLPGNPNSHLAQGVNDSVTISVTISVICLMSKRPLTLLYFNDMRTVTKIFSYANSDKKGKQ